MTDVPGLSTSKAISFDVGYWPQTSYIFPLRGTGNVLVLFYIYYPIVPYAPAFLHSFLLLESVVQGKDPKRHSYFYSLVLELFLCYSTSIRQYPTHQHFLHSSCYFEHK